MSGHKRPGIKDVAKAAGVSEGTVSVVLNGRVGENVRVSELTQQKVWDAVRALGYVANPVAQRLAGGSNQIIAVFTFEPVFPMDASSFYYPFLIGIEQEADHQGYDLLLITGTSDPHTGTRRIYANNVNRLSRADGALLLGHGDRSEVQRLLDEGFPFVYVGRRDSPNDNISYVAADYVAAAKEVVTYLYQHHHMKIACIMTRRQTEATQDRLQGIRLAARELNIQLGDDLIWTGGVENFSAGMMQAYLEAGVTAFIGEDDTVGRHLLALGESLSLRCPLDYSLAVLGNPLNPMQHVPNWTSFNIPRREMGREALRLLVELLTRSGDESQPLRKLLPVTFVPGTTTRTI